MKILSVLTSAAVASSLAFTLAGQASATTFKFDWEKADGTNLGKSEVDGKAQKLWVNHGVGSYDSINTTFNDVTDEFTFSADFTNKGNAIDGGWVVISDGPNPKKHDKEFAILYLDAVNDRVTAYAYNGQNNANSFRTNELLGSWEGIMNYENESGKSSFNFSIDATEINARTDIGNNWKGLTFGEQVGIWFHAGRNTNVTYDSNTGDVTSFSSQAKWYDTIALDTEVVPEAVPEPTALLGLGLVGGAFAVSRRRKDGSIATEGADLA